MPVRKHIALRGSALIARASIDRVSLFDLRRRIEKFKSADLNDLTLLQVEARIRRIMDAYSTVLQPLDLTGVFRARKNVQGQEFLNASELWYPPAGAITKLGRLNKIGESVFYASNKANVASFETRPAEGDVITIMKAVTLTSHSRLECIQVGLIHSSAPEIQHLKRDTLPQSHVGHLAMLGSNKNREKWRTIDEFLCQLLLSDVPVGKEHLYKPTVALANILKVAPHVEAINYPSVATSLNGLNICLAPEIADRLFRPAAFYMLQIGKQVGSLFQIVPVKKAGPPDATGHITWMPVTNVVACMQEISQSAIKNLRVSPIVNQSRGSY